MNMAADDIVVERPVVSTVLVAAVATLVYVVLQLLLDGFVDVVETAAFVGIFTVVYVGGNWLLRRRAAASSESEASEDTSEE